jgi:hypothetical protein
LYGAVNTANPNPNPPGDTGTPPAEWVVACNEAYQRPDTFLTNYPVGSIGSLSLTVPIPRVAEWLDYIRNSITYYFAWCPQHTEALAGMGQVYTDREPIASIQDMLDFVNNIKVTLQGYQALGGSETDPGYVSQEPELFSDTGSIGTAGGGAYSAPDTSSPWSLFMVGNVDPAASVWYGGQIDMAASLGQSNLSIMDSYQTLCTTKFYPLFGIATNSYCSLMSLMRYSKIVTMILLAIDLFVMVWFLLKYMPGYIRRFWDIITGNKGAVKKVLGAL